MFSHWGTRYEDGKYLHRGEFEDIELPEEGLPLDEVITRLQEIAASEYTNIRVTAQHFTDRDGDSTGESYINVEGDRPATEKEIEGFKAAEAKHLEKQRQQAEAEVRRQEAIAARAKQDDLKALERAREAFPELFKEEHHA